MTHDQIEDAIKSIGRRLDEIERDIRLNIKPSGRSLSERLSNLAGVEKLITAATPPPPPENPKPTSYLHPLAKDLHAAFCEAIDSLNPPSFVQPPGHPAFESLPQDVQEAWRRVALEAKSILCR